MLDLSNNNSSANFPQIKMHHDRVYHKLTEGTGFVDRYFAPRRKQAHASGIKFGAYLFAHPLKDSPSAEADFFLKHLPPLVKGKDLIPVIDVEFGTPSAKAGAWAHELSQALKKHLPAYPIFYSYSYYISGLKLTKPVGRGLWIAAYGRNDGKLHPVGKPAPWKNFVAMQYTSRGQVFGVGGYVDVSKVYNPTALEVP